MRRWLTALTLLPVLSPAAPAAAQDLAGTLDATLADALTHAPSLAEAQAGKAAAGARLDGARAETMPILSVTGQIGVGRLDNGGFFGFAARGVTPMALQAGAEMPLYTGGRIAAGIDQARGGMAMAHLALADARSRTMVGAVAAYAEVLTARRIEARFLQQAGTLAEVERQARLRFQVGEIPASDLATATARRAEGEAGLAAAQGRRTIAEAQFSRITGHDAGALAPLPPPPPTPATLDEAIEAAHRANPALAQAEKAIDVAQAGVRGAKAESMPTIGAFAEGTHTRDEFFPGYQADAFAVGLRARWTLWAGGRTAAKIHEADANLDASQARARDMRDAVNAAVISAWSGFRTASQMIDASAARAAAAREALRSTRLEARVGAKPTLAVLDAEREAASADAAAIEAEGQQAVAAWQLDALTGTLPELAENSRKQGDK